MPRSLGILGGGVAAGAILVELANRVRRGAGIPVAKIFVFEPQHELGRGTPYSTAVNDSALTITPMRDVFPSEILIEFQRFMEIESDGSYPRSIEEFCSTGVGYIPSADALLCIQNRCFCNVHMPRRIVGDFLQARLHRAFQTLECAGIDVEHIREPAHSIYMANNTITTYTDGTEIRTDRAVLCVGSIARPLSAPSSLNSSLSCRAADAVERIAYLSRSSRIVIFGSNASTIELLYLARTLILAGGHTVRVISPSGSLPAFIDAKHPIDSTLIRPLREAAFDPDYAPIANVLKNIADCLDNGDITRAIGTVGSLSNILFELDNTSRINIVNRVMPFVVRAVRRVEGPYAVVLDDGEAGLFQLHSGCLDDITSTSNGRMNVSWIDSHGGAQFDEADLVVNCTDIGLYADASDLVRHLVSTYPDTLSLTDCGRGLHVDDEYRAARNLYVFGPLLAGNAREFGNIWHLESTKNIMKMAKGFVDSMSESSTWA